MKSSTAAKPMPSKLADLQILRGLASTLVVADHSIYARESMGIRSPQYWWAATWLGSMGVAAFFVLSGYLMVRQSTSLFGVAGSPALFAYRRIARVVPMYWIATLAWTMARVHWHDAIPHLGAQVLLSMLFLPNFFSKPALDPLLYTGWTLNYEIAFYALFSVCLTLPRRLGLGLLLSTLAAAFGAGWFVPASAAASVAGLLYFYTRPYMGLFLAGVVIGVVTGELALLPRRRPPFSPALLLCIPAVALVVVADSDCAEDSMESDLRVLYRCRTVVHAGRCVEAGVASSISCSAWGCLVQHLSLPPVRDWRRLGALWEGASFPSASAVAARNVHDRLRGRFELRGCGPAPAGGETPDRSHAGGEDGRDKLDEGTAGQAKSGRLSGEPQ